jgi:TPR repeat protein
VVKDVEMEEDAWKQAFAKTEKPLGQFFAGKLSKGKDPTERFGFFKKSAEAGCSWGQVQCGVIFRGGHYPWLARKNITTFREWMEKAADQNNPCALFYLGHHLLDDSKMEEKEKKEKTVPYILSAAELGWKGSFYSLSKLLSDGKYCPQDWRQAVMWSAKATDSIGLWIILVDAMHALENKTTKDLNCNFHQLCYSLGWGLYWYVYGRKDWNVRSDKDKVFGNRCLDYYCTCVELQRKSILAFLWCWNQTYGVKDMGEKVAKMAWEEREDNLIELFAEI